MTYSNATMAKFAYPDSLVKEFARWVVLLRPAQVTLGSLVLVCKDPARALPEISAEAFAELAQVTAELERCLKSLWNYQKINYLMLMMVDPDVHFHVIPRYDQTQHFADLTFEDAGWPGPPALASAVALDAAPLGRLVAELRSNWPG